ncbi:hypothetical protein ACN28E_01735 [Archangium lansingense]|uniref:hypothetical protein n=1 Tax=Archangium lansingense TaxID=2995310 RepID=UPI003B81D717
MRVNESVHPPEVSHFHHRFEGWLGDELLEVFPCFLVSSALANALEETRLVGFSLRDVEVSTSPEFQELYPGRALPEFRWLKITGKDRDADFWLTPDSRLEVSSRTLGILRKFKIAHAVIEAPAG